VVHILAGERLLRAGAQPQVEVALGRNDTLLRGANRTAAAIDDGASQLDLAQLAGLDELGGRLQPARRTVLRAALADAVVLAGSLHHAAAFHDVVADRLFDIHIFAGLHGPDRGQRVPVVG